MGLALLRNRRFRGKRIVRAAMLLPFIVPTVLSTFAWRWMFGPTFSVLTWLLFKGGFIVNKLPFLSDGAWAMWCAIVINTWRGMPFFAITLLAGLQTINPDLHEAASPDSQFISVLTGGGPANSTHLLATYAYQLGVATGLLGEGAAVSLFMFPVLFAVVWIQLRYLRRLEGA